MMRHEQNPEELTYRLPKNTTVSCAGVPVDLTEGFCRCTPAQAEALEEALKQPVLPVLAPDPATTEDPAGPSTPGGPQFLTERVIAPLARSLEPTPLQVAQHVLDRYIQLRAHLAMQALADEYDGAGEPYEEWKKPVDFRGDALQLTHDEDQLYGAALSYLTRFIVAGAAQIDLDQPRRNGV